MTNAILQLVNIEKEFDKTGLEPIEVFSNVNLSLHSGEMVGLFSPSGAGKTTLLQIAGLLDGPSSGKIIVDGNDADSLSDLEKTNLRNKKIGFVYQFHHLLPEFSAMENVCVPQWCLGVSRRNAEEKARHLLDLVGLSHRRHHRPSELSGGEQQRVALCRALINDPKILLADEPTGNLDSETSELVFDLLVRLVKEKKLSALIVSHNLGIVKRMDRVVRLHNKTLKPMDI
jgi:lipoprotein-releasing system ATP-binding protein